MTVKPLAEQEIAGKGYTHVVTLEYTDFNDTAGLTKTVAILPATLIVAGKEVRCHGFYVETAFAGTTTLTLQCGDGGDPDRFLTAALADLKTAGYKSVSFAVTTQPSTYTTGDTVDVLATATVENLTALTAGKAHLFLEVVDHTTSI